MPWTAEQNREYMREYMRRYRNPDSGCEVCGKRLSGRQIKFCSRKCRQRDYYVRYGERGRERYRRWHEANRERSVARIKAWKLANPERTRGYVRMYRAKKCPFCENTLCWPAVACKICALRYGAVCHDNPACGVAEKHKHCPCGLPVEARYHRRIEFCSLCQREMAGISLVEFWRDSAEEAA